jgi:hypothetical protein
VKTLFWKKAKPPNVNTNNNNNDDNDNEHHERDQRQNRFAHDSKLDLHVKNDSGRDEDDDDDDGVDANEDNNARDQEEEKREEHAWTNDDPITALILENPMVQQYLLDLQRQAVWKIEQGFEPPMRKLLDRVSCR